MSDARPYQDVAQQAQRVVFTIQRQPGWVTKAAIIAGSLVAIAIMLVLVLPVLLVMFLVFIAAMIIAKIRAVIRGLSAPNGALDGRENVRVIVKR